jgi:hypothetical protein
MAVTQQNSNNLVDRIVGDVTTQMNYGALDNNTVIKDHALDTQSNLTGTIFDPANAGQPGNLANATIGSLTSGELFYLLSLQKTPAQLAEWFGSGITDNPLFYNNYGNDFIGDTNAYTYAYTDRLSNLNSPDLFYTPSGGTLTPNDEYIQVVLGAGDYTFAVPEPSAGWVIPLLLAGMGLMRWRSRRAV